MNIKFISTKVILTMVMPLANVLPVLMQCQRLIYAATLLAYWTKLYADCHVIILDQVTVLQDVYSVLSPYI